MTILTKWFVMDGKEGVDLNFVQTSVDVTTLPEVPAPRANLGDRVQGNNGSEWIFVKAGTTVTAFNILAITPGFSAQNLTQALIVSNAYSYAIAEFQTFNGVTIGNASGGVANTNDFFWALRNAAAGIRLNVTGTAAPGGAFFMSGSSGIITSSTQSVAQAGRLNGLMYLGSVSVDGASIAVKVASAGVEFGMYSYIMPAANLAAITV